MAFLASIFKSTSDVVVKKGVTYRVGADGTEELVKCLFCDIMGKREPGDIISESKEFVVFRTIKPYTEHHLLVVPRVHVCSVDTMKGEEDAAMIERMALEGKNTLNKIESGLGESAQFSFHIPPLNSIDHLHLHAIGRPETLSMIGGIKYWTGAPYCWDVSKAAENTRSKM